jgi:dTDP-4-amino-4,6-dideoxygalactose transaminase
MCPGQPTGTHDTNHDASCPELVSPKLRIHGLPFKSPEPKHLLTEKYPLIPFNRPYIAPAAFEHAAAALALQLRGATFTAQTEQRLEQLIGCRRAFLSRSCTSALELSALLLDVESGDEIIMPSFTFPSTANAFVLRGARPVFVDVRRDTLNLDESLVEEAISPRTNAIVAVHYAGVGCNMDAINATAARHGLSVIEDAAHGIGASYRGRALGSFGAVAAISFHETKNVSCGQGGALLVNDEGVVTKAEILREFGTNRAAFRRKEVERYQWLSAGTSDAPSEIVAAVLLGQLNCLSEVTTRRRQLWQRYFEELSPYEANGWITLPAVPHDCAHNGHIFYVICRNSDERNKLQAALGAAGISASTHYEPLHRSPAGQRFCSTKPLPITEKVADTLLRLPIYFGMTGAEQDMVFECMDDFFNRLGSGTV